VLGAQEGAQRLRLAAGERVLAELWATVEPAGERLRALKIEQAPAQLRCCVFRLLLLGRGVRREQQARAQQHQPARHDQPRAPFAERRAVLLQGSGKLIDEIPQRQTTEVELPCPREG
jgi:hypothetical protein